MKREIKFRAWDKKRQAMVRFGEGTRYSVHFDGTIEEFIPALESDFYGVISHRAYFNDKTDEFILMQYTGLKDKKGKEIFEGDITNQGWLVIFESGCFWLTSHDTTFKVDYLYMLNNEIEIIGNIYENKEN